MRHPQAWEGSLLVFFFLLLLLGLNLLLGLLQAFIQRPLPISPILIIGELLILGVTIVWAALRRLPWQETFYLHKPSWPLMGLSILVAITWWPLATGLAVLIEQPFSLIGPPPEIPLPLGPFDALGYFIAIVILAPLCEEPVFRGLIMRGWLRYGVVAGIIGSGVLFGLQHAQLAGLIPLSVAGIMLGVVAFRAGSLWPSILVHAIYNGLSFPLFLWSEALPDISDLTFIIAGAVASPFAFYTLWLYHRKASPLEYPKCEPLERNHLLALIVSSLLVLGLFIIFALLELVIRLNPELAGL